MLGASDWEWDLGTGLPVPGLKRGRPGWLRAALSLWGSPRGEAGPGRGSKETGTRKTEGGVGLMEASEAEGLWGLAGSEGGVVMAGRF